MPVKRRLSKGKAHRITSEALEAFEARDFIALHRALGLGPWEASPLPASVTELGVDPDNPANWNDCQRNTDSWAQAVELQRELQRAVRDA